MTANFVSTYIGDIQKSTGNKFGAVQILHNAQGVGVGYFKYVTAIYFLMLESLKKFYVIFEYPLCQVPINTPNNTFLKKKEI